MTNIHRLPPAPKLKRHGVIRCEIDASIPFREMHAVLAHSGFVFSRERGVWTIERANRGNTNGRV